MSLRVAVWRGASRRGEVWRGAAVRALSVVVGRGMSGSGGANHGPAVVSGKVPVRTGRGEPWFVRSRSGPGRRSWRGGSCLAEVMAGYGWAGTSQGGRRLARRGRSRLVVAWQGDLRRSTRGLSWFVTEWRGTTGCVKEGQGGPREQRNVGGWRGKARLRPCAEWHGAAVVARLRLSRRGNATHVGAVMVSHLMSCGGLFESWQDAARPWHAKATAVMSCHGKTRSGLFPARPVEASIGGRGTPCVGMAV